MHRPRPKGARSIHVDGREFWWTLRRKPTYAQAIGQTKVIVSVRLAAVRGSRLVIRFSGAHPRNFLGLPSASVTPRDVASGIVAAIRAGWRPDVAGASFVFDSIDVAGD